MEDYIYDSEPHALDDKLAYILKKVDPYTKGFDLKDEVMAMYKKYAEYLMANDKEKALEYMMKVFQHYVDFEQAPENTSLVYRAPHTVSPLAQYGSLALKFERAKEDTLVTQ